MSSDSKYKPSFFSGQVLRACTAVRTLDKVETIILGNFNVDYSAKKKKPLPLHR